MLLFELFESVDPIRLSRNPDRQHYTELAERSKENFVRALIGMDRNWYCWPGDLAEHMTVIQQTGLTDVIPVRLYGIPGGDARVEVTDTRYKLPTGTLSADWLKDALARFIAGKKLFRHTEIQIDQPTT